MTIEERVKKLQQRLFFVEQRLREAENIEDVGPDDCKYCLGKGFWLGTDPAQRRVYACVHCEAGRSYSFEVAR